MVKWIPIGRLLVPINWTCFWFGLVRNGLLLLGYYKEISRFLRRLKWLLWFGRPFSKWSLGRWLRLVRLDIERWLGLGISFLLLCLIRSLVR